MSLYTPHDDLPPALIRAELARVLASSSFRHALQLQRLLKYMVDAVLTQQDRKLREFSLALDCFQRNAGSYDPRKDPIVRVAAGRLREKLHQYYENEGDEAYLEISLPVGSYAPSFAKRVTARGLSHNSVAVLPFVNASQVPAGIDAFSDELVAELIDALTRVPGLKVVARASASRFRDGGQDTRVIGATLGVSALLRGGVEHRDDRVRVSARLESARDGALLWSGVFDEAMGIPFAVQNQIAAAVVGALRRSSRDGATLPSPAGSVFVKRGTASPAAKDLHDRGRFALRQQGVEGYRKAVELFEQAVAVDRQFASAYSGLALAHLGLVAMTAVPAASHVSGAKSAVQRALELDPQSSEACSSLAVITFRYEFNFRAAEPLYQMAIRFAPGSRQAHHAYAFALMMSRRFDEADLHYRTARDLDPLDHTLRCQHALISVYTGRYEDAEAELHAVIDVDGSNVLARTLLGATYLYSGRFQQALEEYEWAVQAAPSLSIGLCGKAQALALSGERERALRVLQEMLDRYGEQFVSPYQVAMVEARLGNDGAAFQWLDRAARERDANFVCAHVDPAFGSLRAHRDWRTLMERHGLSETPPSEASPRGVVHAGNLRSASRHLGSR
jgi:TolB-like protein/Flp pilus assembly protein TadD